MSAVLQPKLAAAGQRAKDGVPDMTAISDLDVEGVNENLSVRFRRGEIYTYTGTILVAVNPYEYYKLYEPEMMRKYAGKKMGELDPHVFATAQAAYMNVQTSDQNQSCVISGESGAGKTETTKFILQYLCTITSTTSNWVEQQILECNVILEAFGNAKTIRNDNSSRFGKFMQVCFDKDIEIKGMIVQEYLLEQSRITFQSADERNYHVFYQLCKGADKKEFLLDDITSYSYLNQSGCYDLEKINDTKELESLRMAMTVLNIEEHTQTGILKVVSAVLHIGNMQFEGGGESSHLTKNDERICSNVAKLLSIDKEGFRHCTTTRNIVVRGESTDIPLKLHEARENRHAMAKALYSRTFTWLVDAINQTTNPGSATSKFIGVLDIFGFENFVVNSFEQLCINFTNEKLHKFFNHYVFALEQAEYEKEEINFAHIEFTDNTVCLELLEKPPMCVLKLLDEECKIPKGSDIGYLEKQHKGLEHHPNYEKGSDRRNWETEFHIHHFAGRVTYTVEGFLAKNKDVDQATMFDLMRSSDDEFVKDVTKFQDMLAMDRKMIMGEKIVAGDNAPMMQRRKSVAMTNKQKPTVGDSFRRQLQRLVDILDTTTPWYVRCIKPNATKKAKTYDNELCKDQLNYSGMLDIVRIRREGFPVHVPAEVFVAKYRAMAQVMGKKLSNDPKKACVEILTFIKAPETEWQIGKTKIFLRNSVFEPLEEKLKAMLYDKVVLIQSIYRGWRQRMLYKKKKLAIVKIQAAITGAPQRLHFLLMRRSAVKIQSWWKGCLARVRFKAMKIRRAAEIAKKKKKEEERRKKELAEKGDTMMEDSFLAAQKELFEIAKLAEKKVSAHNKSNQGESNLDGMFTMLADDSGGTNEKELKNLDSELDSLLAQPTQATQINRGDGVKTIKRKKRIKSAVETLEAEEKAAEQKAMSESVNVNEFPMIKYADVYFNDHPKATGTLLRKSARNLKAKAAQDPLPKEDMLVYTKSMTLATSMIHMHNPANINLAVTMFKDINRFLRKELKTELEIPCFQSVVGYCLEQEELRDEIYCQLMRQSTNNPNPEEQERAWWMLCVCCSSFPPARHLYKYLLAFIKKYERDQLVGRYAHFAGNALRKIKYNGRRRRPPGAVEINAIGQQQHIICRFYFLDGKAKAVGVQPSWTASDVIQAVADKMSLQSTAGWSLFESTPQAEHFIRGHEYVGDILAEWEQDDRSSLQAKPYKTISRGGPAAALGLGDAKFVFRKRLFLNPKVIPTDPQEYNLLFAQAVHSAVRVDEFPVSESTALKLAGLQAQVTWGDAKLDTMTRYEDVMSFLPVRIIRSPPERSREHWMQAIYNAHNKYGKGKSGIRAKVLYLTAVKQYPLYGGTFFDVKYLGFWSHPERLLISIDVEGFKFVHQHSKEVFQSYPYAQMKNVSVNAYEETITFNMHDTASNAGANFMFLCPRKDDIANLIASYSPAHRTWKQVGTVNAGNANVSEDEKAKFSYDVTRARAQLARSGLLLAPPERKSANFLANTLRRMGSSKGSRIGDVDEGGQQQEDLDKVYDTHYWSYSKHRIPQSLMAMASPESTEIALKTFNSLLIHAGLAPPQHMDGGYHNPVDQDGLFFTLIQEVIARCLEKEDVCNELYCQMVKQTTSHPHPTHDSNLANWKMLALVIAVVVPRQKLLLQLLHSHLRLYSLNINTEEGLYAAYIQQLMVRTLENGNRKYPPSRNEIICVTRRQQIYARFYFMDGEFRSMNFDPAATTAEVVMMVKERIGLAQSVAGFSLFEVFGSLERNMLPWEKVGDAIFKWEKYGKSTRSQKELHLTFKKRLFIGEYTQPKSEVEFDLILYQAMDDIRNDRFPISNEDTHEIVALHAQIELGDTRSMQGAINYNHVVEKYLPEYVHSGVDVEAVRQAHIKLSGKSSAVCKQQYMALVTSWELYGATVFDVTQQYTTSLPKNLWLAVNEHGIHIMKRRSKEPLITYQYKDIVNYSPSLKNLMIVTESLTQGPKYVFTTNQASQIAHLIKDYTHIIIQRSSGGGEGAKPAVRASNGNSPAKSEPKRRSAEYDGFGEDDFMESSSVPVRKNSGQYGF